MKKIGNVSVPSVVFVGEFCGLRENNYHRKHRPKPHGNRVAEDVIIHHSMSPNGARRHFLGFLSINIWLLAEPIRCLFGADRGIGEQR